MNSYKFSTAQALAFLETVKSKLDGNSYTLYQQLECLHDAYIQEFNLSTTSGQVDCCLTLMQDTCELPPFIQLHMYNVQKLELTVSPAAFLWNEVYYLYLMDAGNGIRIECRTDEMLYFSCVAGSVSIENFAESEYESMS